ncbi:MAG: sugar ABC transporter ATP-binding protein [Acidimicrobiia bacterium]|nr:sugar ABC transporter ATP-binding protein [Acidimicrobiia bacterium]
MPAQVTQSDIVERAPTPANDVVLGVRGVSKTFSGQTVLSDVSMDLRAREVHALVGHNGSGKSTLVKILTGFHLPDDGGEAHFGGQEVDLYHHGGDWRRHVRAIHQDLALVGSMSIADNLALARGFATRFGGRIDDRKDARLAQAILADLGMTGDMRRPVGSLSLREQALVAIARAIDGLESDQEAVLVLDEATATLPDREVQLLFDAIRKAAERGCAVLYVSHILSEIFEVADRVTVLRDGWKIGEWTTDELSIDRLAELIVGRKVETLSFEESHLNEQDVRLNVLNLESARLKGVSFKLHRGEVLGIAGLDGSGREDVTRILFGLDDEAQADVRIEGESVAIPSPQAAMDLGIGLVPADRLAEGLFLTMSTKENITLPQLQSLTVGGWISTRRERSEARKWIDRLGVLPTDPNKATRYLSGGNAQKVVLSKWLRRDPAILLLEQPTAGVDVGARGAIWNLIRSEASVGTSIVVTSPDWDELPATCDRVLVLAGGRISAELTGADLNEDSIAHYALLGDGTNGTGEEHDDKS